MIPTPRRFCLTRLAAPAFALLLGLTAAPAAQAQINININTPSWGPPAPPTAQYYYLPEMEGYYDLRAAEYVYLTNGRWMRARALPTVYRGVAFQPVVVDYVGAKPWVQLPVYRVKYPKPGKGYGKGKGKGGPPVFVGGGPPDGMPPGQAKKMGGGKPGKGGHGHGHDKH